MNKVILIGNITKDPELQETQSGVPYTKMTIAVSRSYANSEGERETDFFDFTVWRERAENCCKYLQKGSKVAVVGSIENRTYENEEGEKRKITEIKCNEIEFLSSRKSESEEERPQTKKTRPTLTPVDDDEDLPF